MIHRSNYKYIERGKGQKSLKMESYDYLLLTWTL